MAQKKKWIAGAIKKPGALRATLGVKKGKKIPKGKLSKIARAKVGKTVKLNGKKRVTGKLKKRAVLARTLARVRRK